MSVKFQRGAAWVKTIWKIVNVTNTNMAATEQHLIIKNEIINLLLLFDY